MSYNNQSAQKQTSIVSLKLLLAFFLICALTIFTVSTFADELNPSHNIKPSQSEPALGNFPEQSTLTNDMHKIEDPIHCNSTSEPSWWNWITNASSKPANFHYIDIIELLS